MAKTALVEKVEAQAEVLKSNRVPPLRQLCGRPRAVYRKFGICRICLRDHALLKGEIPGMRKASW